MTVGVVFFAFNNSTIDYVKIAQWNAANVQRHLGLPVTLVTDIAVSDHIFDRVLTVSNSQYTNRYFDDAGTQTQWKNFDRYTAYQLSPYDTTLLLDVDYVVASDQLNTLIGDSRNFVCYSHAVEASGTTDNNPTFGRVQMPMFWATVIKFDKTPLAQMIFDCVQMIQHNYSHYAALYGFARAPYRNDYALSIALSIVGGHKISNDFACAWPLLNVNPAHAVEQVGTDTYEITYNKTVGKDSRNFRIQIKNQDLHVMGKTHLEKIIERC